MAHENGSLYTALTNDEGQYSVWPADREVPAGWRSTGAYGTPGECRAWVDGVWTDLRPRGPRPGPPVTPAPVHELIAAQAVRRPDATAVSGRGTHLTYAELDRHSAELARRLTALGVGPETVVGLCVDRGPALVVGLLAILRSGGAYLPMDPAHPARRLASQLTDSGAGALLTDLTVPVPPTRSDVPVVVVDPNGLERGAPAPAPLPPGAASPPTPQGRPTEVTADQLAYVIHTSGSSGTPKAVQVSHGSLAHLLTSVVDRLPLTGSDTLLAVTTVCFDIAGLELLAPLLAGGRVVVADRSETTDGTALARRLAQEEATFLQATPATWQLLLDAGWRPTPRLTMLCGGEALPSGLARRLLEGDGRLWNLYGPTETTIWSSAARVTLPLDEVSLGHPLGTTRIHLLDPDLRPVEAGGTGEIAIAGAGLARGYAGQPGLTAQRFPADPHAERPGERLYLTGDLARRLPDGTLRYLGRIDDQLKVRGHRIEPDEVEECAAAHPLVRRAVVTAVNPSDPACLLVAALVPLTPGVDRAALAREVRTRLEENLPPYMVPDRLLVLDEMPLSATGKVDRRALAELAATHRGTPGAVTPATTPVEHELVELFRTILGVPRVGVHDDFFDLGGHSMLAARLALQIQRRFAVRLPLARLIRHATVAGLAAAIEEQDPAGHPKAPAARPAAEPAGRTEPVDDDPVADIRLDGSVTAVGLPMSRWQRPRRILLTGSTGYLGAHLLGELTRRTDAEIVCLVRGRDRATARDRLNRALRRYGVAADHGRTTVLPGDLARPGLGLPEDDFAALARTVDVIYHNGSQVNLVLPYAALRAANVGGTREIIRLACQEQVKPVHYVSTIGILRGTGAPSPWTEEAAPRPPGTPDGYVRSKWAAERLLTAAGERGLPVTFHRPFLVMGHTVTGACTPDNFLSIMLRALLDLGVFPKCDARLDIVPVDFVSRALVEICRDGAPPGGTYHFASPSPATFQQVHEWLLTYGYDLTPVDYPELGERLAGLPPDHPAYGVMPLLQAQGAEQEYHSVFNQSFSCANTWERLRDSGITCEPVGEETVHRALSYFVGTGFLEAPREQRDRVRRSS